MIAINSNSETLKVLVLEGNQCVGRGYSILEYFKTAPMIAIPANPQSGGVKGRAITVKTNVFPITALREAICYQYDITMDPEVPADVSRRAFRQVEVMLKQKQGDVWFVFDGVKNAFSMTSIGDCKYDIIVEKNPEEMKLPAADESSRGGYGGSRGGRGGRGGGRGGFTRQAAPCLELKPCLVLDENTVSGNFEKISVNIRQVSQVDLHNLILYAQGKRSEDDSITHASTALSVALRHVPSMLYVPVGSNFFSPEGRSSISGGLEVWRGFHQSIRAMQAGHLGINIDIASTVFRKGGMSVIDYLIEVCDLRDVSGINNAPAEVINRAIKGVNVVTTHRGDQKQRFKVSKLSRETAHSMKFEGKDKKSISVAEYFETEYQIKLRYPHLPLILKSNGKTAFPLECLSIIPSQRYKARLNGAQTSDMIRATTQKPVDRQAQIQDGVKRTLKYEENDYLKSFGLEIGREMMDVNARILPSPSVVFSREEKLNASSGQWNLRFKKVIDAPELSSFAFVFFCKTTSRDANEVRDVILQKWVQAGMNIKNFNAPVLICNPQISGNVRGGLMAAFKEATTTFKTRCQMIICIVDGSKPIYEQIKRICLCEAGVMSQCMAVKNVRDARSIKDQYICNVALKANIKLGGSTNHIDMPLSTVPTMYMGGDVTHPAPGSSEPSICSVVASTDNNVTKYNTYLRAQTHRVEIIEEMRSVAFLALQDYAKANGGQYPARIIFYRDGVSRGQFDEVRNVEIRALKSAMDSIKCTATVTYVIILKRHHIRLFPTNRSDTDRSENCLPGTVIDRSITHPTDFNFILQSHAGLQGMSRPTIYNVIYDENRFTYDEIQQISYNLCFLSERATRTIAMPSPVYRAHLAAFYARIFLDGGDDASEAGSSRSGSSTVTLKKFAHGMENTHYYL